MTNSHLFTYLKASNKIHLSCKLMFSNWVGSHKVPKTHTWVKRYIVEKLLLLKVLPKKHLIRTSETLKSILWYVKCIWVSKVNHYILYLDLLSAITNCPLYCHCQNRDVIYQSGKGKKILALMQRVTCNIAGNHNEIKVL